MEYLFLNRGVNAVCPIDLSQVIPAIDFNSSRIQVYPPNQGLPELRKAVQEHYFHGNSDIEHISIVPGGMAALDLSVQCLQLDRLYHADYFWGSYAKLAKIRGVQTDTYSSLHELTLLAKHDRLTSRTAVLICDPNNPTGVKMDEEELLSCINLLDEKGVIVLFDSPYRYVFNTTGDTLFSQLAKLQNVIITESFSKSMGLSGQRIGFIHSMNAEFNSELGIRILYSMNGVNAFAQELILHLLTTANGRNAVDQFRLKTRMDIRKNVVFLKENNLLADDLYKGKDPLGIFAVVNRSEEELLHFRIGSVSMDYFTREKTRETNKHARICLSVPHDQFHKYFSRIKAGILTGAQ
ncbi:MAG: pyridoxal phosphate-dependent aminotransferase [Bacteroidia bacterium]